MAVRILWDKYETALLIDACAKIMAREESRKDAIKRVSTALRKRAVDNGLEIDDVFRNESGITLQLANLQQLMEKHSDFPTRNNSKLFKEMVQMYNTDRERFNGILAAVKGEAQQVKVESRPFREWLSNNEKAKKAISEQDICDTEAYAAKKGCIKQSIQEIETYSQLTVLTGILRNDRLFRLFHSRQVQGMNQVLHMYAEYLENGKSPDLQQQNAEQQYVGVVTDEERTETGQIAVQDVNSSNDREIPEREASEEESPAHLGDSLNEKENADTRHTNLILEEPSLPESYVVTLSNNLESAEVKKTELDEENSDLSVTVGDTNTDDETLSVGQIQDETEPVFQPIAESKNEADRGNDTALSNNHTEFTAWLREKNHSESFISMRLFCINRLSELSSEYGVSKQPFIEVTDPDRVEQEWRSLSQIPAFKSWINSHRGKYKNSINEYLQFLKERKNTDRFDENVVSYISDTSESLAPAFVSQEELAPTAETVEDDPKKAGNDGNDDPANDNDNQAAFIEWLSHEELTSTKASLRVNAIKRLSELLQEHDTSSRPFFEISNYKEMEQKWNRLLQIPKTRIWVKNRGGIYRISMNYYLRFLKEQHRTEENETQNRVTEHELPADERKTEPTEPNTDLTEITDIRDPLLEKLSEKHLEYYDLRFKGGCLWVVGDLELTEYMISLNKAFCISFRFKPGGGNATSGRDAWWTSDQISSTAEKTSEPSKQINMAHSDDKKTIETEKDTREQNIVVAKNAAAELILFSNWLKKQSITGKMRDSIIAAVSRIDVLAQNAGFVNESVYAISEHKILEELWSKLCADDDFEQYQQQNRIAQFAFNKYVEYRWENNQVPNNKEIAAEKESVKQYTTVEKRDNPDQEEKKNKEEFWLWLRNSQGLAEMTCNGLVSAVSRTSLFGTKDRLIQKSLFTVCSAEELKTLWTIIQKNQHFTSFDRQNGHRFSRAMGRYLTFWKAQEYLNDEIRTDEKKNNHLEEATLNGRIASAVSLSATKTDFIRWLIDNGGSSDAPWTTPRALDKVNELAVRRKYVTDSLYEITDPIQLSHIRERIEDDPGYATLTERDSAVDYALRSYCDFRNSIKSQQTEHSVDESETLQTGRQAQGEKEYKAEFEDWLKRAETPSGSIIVYTDAIERIGNYLLKNGDVKQHLYTITDVNELDRIRSQLAEDKNYATSEPNVNCHLDLYAFKKYISFRKNGLVCDDKNPLKERFATVLLNNFENGFRPKSVIDRNRFKQYYQEQFGEELTLNDDAIVKMLRTVGAEQDDRIFGRRADEERNLLNELKDEIASAFQSGASCVYITALYDRFQEPLAEQLQIYSAEVMKEQLMKNANGAFRASKHYFYSRFNEPDPDKDILKTMRQSTVPMNYEQIQKMLWFIPLDVIKRSLVMSPEIVNVAQETYFYAGNLPVSPIELNQLAGIIHEELLQRNFLTDTQLRGIIQTRCPSIAINTENFTIWGLRNTLAVLLKTHFSFRGPIISELGKEINTADAFEEFCRSQVTLTLDDLKNFAKEISGNVIYWESVYEVMVRISQDEFVQKDQINFDVVQTDHVLDELIENDYLALKDFSLFLYFPVTDVKWNNYVLESYIGQYSHDFQLLHASYTASGTYGAIVRRNSSITNFNELVTDVLSKADTWSNADEALGYLVNKGYLQRRRLADIESIVTEARLLRESRLTE